MSDKDYSNRELDLKFDGLHEKIDQIITQNASMLVQVTKTNGSVKKHTMILIGFGCIVGTLLVVNASPLVTFLTTLIK